ncbi:FecR family protein [Butyricimonas paravirosa]|uniref:FecR family protein n=1 Tax=Butyricimonas paravirosa TaxID=1472417 RepID=UPI002109283E|nr:FecR domain-containing protein [Butyricimonas paravirosa]MCQ4874658.1 DUF4974 domain-containing protein [Butyricimonas paravirosa]
MTNEMDELIRKVLDGKASEEEMRVLMRWMKEDGSHREYFNMLKKVWNMTNGPKLSPERKALEMERFVGYMQNSSLKKREHLKSKVVRLWYRYVAVLLIPLLLLGIYFWSEQKSEPLLVNTETNVDFGKPVLMMADGREVILEQKNEIIEGASEIGIQNDSLSGLNYMGAGLQANVSTGEEVYNTLSIPVGGFYQLSLSDGTKVWLNSMTKLRYPVTFRGEQRNVYLAGEAYFDVAKDADHPFVVNVEGMEVKVYGTRFNVNTLEEGVVQTVLERGKVSVKALKTGEEVMLKPDDMAEFYKESGMVKVGKVDPFTYTAWKDGKFVFENATIETIMSRLGRWYDIKVFYGDEQVKNQTFTGIITRHSNVKDLLYLIGETAMVQFDQKDNVVTVRTR